MYERMPVHMYVDFFSTGNLYLCSINHMDTKSS